MSIVTTNQQPVVLDSAYLCGLASQFDPYSIVTTNISQELFHPLISSAAATIEEDGHPLSVDDITSLIMYCSGDNIMPDEEDRLREIFQQTLSFYDKALPVQSVYAVQAGKKNGLPMPSDRVIYTPDDVIDASKQFLSGMLSKDAFFATMAFYTRVSTFGYYFANDAAWSEFKTWFGNEVAQISTMLSPDTLALCSDLQTISLNHLTESFVLRDDDGQNNEPYSFARLFVFYLMLYEQNMNKTNPNQCIAGHMPFSLAENFCPRTIVITNIEKHAHARPFEIKREWDIVNASMAMKPKVLNSTQIKHLTAVARMAKKMQGQGFTAKQATDARSAIIRFRKTPPTSVDLYKYIMRIYKTAVFIQNSENAVKSKKMTYQRPSRREPDNPDRQGKTTNVKFKPDLHVYLDCSGSISEREYQDAIKSCIKLAKNMNVNFYFNSFSHIMSQTTKLVVKDKSLKEIYDAFKNVPKVGGGTDYEQIWHYINNSAKRSREVSIVISDFEYHAPNHFVKHPRFLYYAPITSSYWNRITDYAKSFAKSMLGICSDIRKHILM